MSTLMRQATVNLAEADPELFAEVDPREVAAAQRLALAKVERVRHGPWPAEFDPAEHRRDIGFLVLDGLLCRRVVIDGRSFNELLGVGDLLRPWHAVDAGASIEYGTLWHAVTDVDYAVLDERFAARMARWPAVSTALLERTMERARSLAFYLAVCHMTGIELRLLVVLWHLADRWGRTSLEGVVLRIPITHAVLAGLVGARRPTVTTALARLEESGHVTRERRDAWILHGEPPVELHRIRTQVVG